jgi:peptidyl-prolyl cis-trans isomerase C
VTKLLHSVLRSTTAGTILLATFLIAPWLHAADALFDDPVVAKSKIFQIRDSDVQEAFTAQKAAAAALGQAVPPQFDARIKRQVLEKLIATKLMLARATPFDQQTGKKLGERLIQEGREKVGSEASYRRRLLAVGSSPEEYEAELLEQAVVQAVIDRELKSKIVISHDDTKKFYDDNASSYQEPEKARVSHILFATRKIPDGQLLSIEERHAKKAAAERVLGRIRAGEDFATLLKDHSEDPEKDKNGELTFSRGGGRVPPQFESAALSLEPGAISEIVTTVFGYHIIKLIEKTPPAQVPLEKVEAQIQEILQRKRVQEQLPEFLKTLREEMGVELIELP